MLTFEEILTQFLTVNFLFSILCHFVLVFKCFPYKHTCTAPTEYVNTYVDIHILYRYTFIRNANRV